MCNKIRIALDGRLFIKEPRGVGKFVFNSIQSMSKLHLFTIDIYSHLPIDYNTECLLKTCDSVNIKIVPLKYFPNKGVLWWLFSLPFLINKGKYDIYWAVSVVYPLGISPKIRVLSTIHDMVYHDFRQTMSVKNRLFMYFFHDRSILNADLLWAVSNYTKSMVQNRYKNRKSSKIFVGSSVDTNLCKRLDLPKKHIDIFQKEFGIVKKFVLFVGTLEPRKNIKYLLQIIPEFLVKYDFQLVIVGGKGWGNNEIAKILNSSSFPKERVLFPGYVTDRELIVLYNLASCFISTSLNEGFGLPQLEALMCGCPVVTSNNSAMTEVVQGYGMLVNGWDKKIWIDSLLYAIEHKSDLLLKNEEIRSKYDWNRIVNNLYSYIRNNGHFNEKE